MTSRRDAFQAMVDLTRRRILLLVASKPMTAREIAAKFDTTQPTIGKHPQILAECKLLQPEKSGREKSYRLNPNGFKEAADFIDSFRKLWEEQPKKMETATKRTRKPSKE